MTSGGVAGRGGRSMRHNLQARKFREHANICTSIAPSGAGGLRVVSCLQTIRGVNSDRHPARWVLIAHNPEPGVMKPDRVALGSGRGERTNVSANEAHP
jgi:hypothetical protein